MRPDQVLPDHVNESRFAGMTVRKGTVAAFLANARLIADPETADEARRDAERDLLESLPALRALGLFDVLAVRDDRVRALIDAAP